MRLGTYLVLLHTGARVETSAPLQPKLRQSQVRTGVARLGRCAVLRQLLMRLTAAQPPGSSPVLDDFVSSVGVRLGTRRSGTAVLSQVFAAGCSGRPRRGHQP